MSEDVGRGKPRPYGQLVGWADAGVDPYAISIATFAGSPAPAHAPLTFPRIARHAWIRRGDRDVTLSLRAARLTRTAHSRSGRSAAQGVRRYACSHPSKTNPPPAVDTIGASMAWSHARASANDASPRWTAARTFD